MAQRSTGSATARPAGGTPAAHRCAARGGAVLGAGVAATVAGLGPLGDEVREITLPLRHEDIIRQQAADKGLDADLIAAVIYEESRFRDQTSHAGARGLMQITPETAEFIAARQRRHRASPRRTWPRRRSTSPTAPTTCATCCASTTATTALAVAAYNAGETNVNNWIAEAGRRRLRDRATSRSPRPAPTWTTCSSAARSTARTTGTSSGSSRRLTCARPVPPTSSSTPPTAPIADQPKARDELAQGHRGRATASRRCSA